MLLPLSHLNYSKAKIIWTIFNIVILSFTIGFLLRNFSFNKHWLIIILILIFSFQPVYANFLYGQAYLFIFSLLVLMWFAYKNDRELLLGFTIGIIFILKSTSFIFLFFYYYKKNVKVYYMQ
ncbi:MAG: DUF2029 domain-containing protein [Ignavibacteria bacterium]|nr:DUF2029 domain-containing protein [Ignavibacteria bacterium]